jgi:cation:H+ antiporter
LGLSAVVSGKVCVERKTLLWDGGVAALVLAVVAVQLYGVLGGGWALCPIAVIMVPYVVITALPPWFIYKVAGRIGLGGMIGETVAAADKDAKRPEKPPRPSTADLLRSISALVAIVVASLGLVHAAITLGAAGHVPDAVLGTLVLASLTGIPNVVAAVKLAMKSRGSAVLSESLNSNTLNLIAGASIPAVVLGIAVLSASVIIALWWMIGMTLLALFLCGLRGGLGRTRGAVLIVLYGAFVVVVLYRG